jgi:hypothetical protein
VFGTVLLNHTELPDPSVDGSSVACLEPVPLVNVFADTRRDASFAAYGDDDLVFLMLQYDLE